MKLVKLPPFLAGLVLFAPTAHATLNIAAGPTRHVSCASGICTATGGRAVLNAGELAAMLASSDVTVNATAGTQTLGIVAPLAWSSSHVLTLNASHDVVVRAAVSVEGPGGLHVTANGGVSAPVDIKFAPGGRIDFHDLRAGFVLNQQSYVLVGDIGALASAVASDPGASYALANDYDAIADAPYKDAPVATTLMGTFEGLGHTVANLSIKTKSKCAGLFAQIGSTSNTAAIARDIRLSAAHVEGRGKSRFDRAGLGPLAGCNYGTVANAYADGEVSGHNAYLGGLIGANYVLVTSSGAATNVTGGQYSDAGGLIGFSQSRRAIAGLRASGTVMVTLRAAAGGLIGSLEGTAAGDAELDRSYATGSVIGSDLNVSAGGLVGHLHSNARIVDSYATGAVHGTSDGRTGGFAGDAALYNGHSGDIGGSYSIGPVTADGTSPNHLGGFVGYDGLGTGHSRDNYWDVDTALVLRNCGNYRNPHRECDGISRRTDAEFKSTLPPRFAPAIWGLDPAINNGYPYLLENPPQ